MPKDTIQIKWHSLDASTGEYESTIAALQSYETQPVIKAGIRLKGRISPAAVLAIMEIASEHQAEIAVSLTAEWESQPDNQLRLFPPDYGTATVADIDTWLKGESG